MLPLVLWVVSMANHTSKQLRALIEEIQNDFLAMLGILGIVFAS
jgi:hypothetical protein